MNILLNLPSSPHQPLRSKIIVAKADIIFRSKVSFGFCFTWEQIRPCRNTGNKRNGACESIVLIYSLFSYPSMLSFDINQASN